MLMKIKGLLLSFFLVANS